MALQGTKKYGEVNDFAYVPCVVYSKKAHATNWTS